jgi:hypothetical protein
MVYADQEFPLFAELFLYLYVLLATAGPLHDREKMNM